MPRRRRCGPSPHHHFMKLKGDPLFVSNVVNPANDPIHRGDCPDRCGRMYDFLDAVVSPADGSVWSSWVDTCTSLDSCSTTRGVGFNAGAETQGVSAICEGLRRGRSADRR